jgi:hypothetical protein
MAASMLLTVAAVAVSMATTGGLAFFRYSIAT